MKLSRVIPSMVKDCIMEITIMPANPVHQFTASHESMTEPVQQAVCMPPENCGRVGSGRWNKDTGPSAHQTDLLTLQNFLHRANLLNTDLRLQGVETTHAEELVLEAARQSGEIRDRQSGTARSEDDPDCARLGKTVSHLRYHYRRILMREDLSPALAKEVLTVAQLLDKIAGSLGYY